MLRSREIQQCGVFEVMFACHMRWHIAVQCAKQTQNGSDGDPRGAGSALGWAFKSQNPPPHSTDMLELQLPSHTRSHQLQAEAEFTMNAHQQVTA